MHYPLKTASHFPANNSVFPNQTRQTLICIDERLVGNEFTANVSRNELLKGFHGKLQTVTCRNYFSL